MTKIQLFDSKQWKYERSRNALFRAVTTWIQKKGKILPTRLPLKYIGTGKVKNHLSELGKSIFINSGIDEVLVKKHVARLGTYDALGSIIYFIFTGLFLVVALTALVLIAAIINVSLDDFNQSTLITITSYMLLFPVIIFSSQLSTALIAKYFADTLTIISGISLLITLEQESDLSDPDGRRVILNEIRNLRITVALLQQTFPSPSNEVEEEIKQLFSNIEEYIDKRERDVIIPTKTTLSSLRKDFKKLVEALIFAQYGSFKTQQSKRAKKIRQAMPLRITERVFRFLVTITPFLLLISLFLFPDYYSKIGLSSNWILLASLAWILLIFDTYLKLGIVERATGILKTIKDLN